jgi:hypothetical protein
MLNRIDNRRVRGPGFTVTVSGIHHVEYSEEDKTAVVEIEGGRGTSQEVNWLVYSETLRGWEPPHQEEVMQPLKRAWVLSKISESLDLLEMPHRIV